MARVPKAQVVSFATGNGLVVRDANGKVFVFDSRAVSAAYVGKQSSNKSALDDLFTDAQANGTYAQGAFLRLFTTFESV